MMKNLLRFTLVALSLLLGSSLAQTSPDHRTHILIPNYIALKIVDANGNLASNPGIDFDYETNVDTYLQLIATGGGSLAPTRVSDFEDVLVTARAGNWSIYVRAFPVSGFDLASGFALSDVEVNRGSVSGLAYADTFDRGGAWINPSWQLADSWQRIARGRGATRGWDSLGFNGHDYSIKVQGDEAPGEHTAVVVYALTFP